MAKCYFNNDLSEGFFCQYNISDRISVEVEYDLLNEIDADDNGLKSINESTSFANRDILVVDEDKHKSYLIKDACQSGMIYHYGPLDNRSIAVFSSFEYFWSDNNHQKLLALPKNPQVKSIRIKSKAVLECLRTYGVNILARDYAAQILQNKKQEVFSVDIGRNNIESISISDSWSSYMENYKISLDLSGFLEINLICPIDYSIVNKYLQEIMIYMQLYYPDSFIMEDVSTQIDDQHYSFVTQTIRPIEHKGSNSRMAVNVKLLDFLRNCYLNMPYRDIEGATRNIPYVIMNTYRNIEDSFLLYFRFIEYFYKSKKNMRENIEIIGRCFHEHFDDQMDRERLKSHSREIVALRNHYTHSGYYIDKSELFVEYDKKNKSTKGYNVTANYEWILRKTDIMYQMVIDIIFLEMLGYGDYHYKTIFRGK